MPNWKIACLICGICRQWRERPLHQVNEDRTIKKIICGYFIELWYTYRLWKLDFSKPAVLEFVTLTFFQYVCWKILLQNIRTDYDWKFLFRKTVFGGLHNKYIPHNKISPKWKIYFRSENPIHILRKYLHLLFSLLLYVVFWHISNGT